MKIWINCKTPTHIASTNSLLIFYKFPVGNVGVLAWEVMSPPPQGRNDFGEPLLPAWVVCQLVFSFGGAPGEVGRLSGLGHSGTPRGGPWCWQDRWGVLGWLPKASGYVGWGRGRKMAPESTFVPGEICRSLLLQ